MTNGDAHVQKRDRDQRVNVNFCAVFRASYLNFGKKNYSHVLCYQQILFFAQRHGCACEIVDRKYPRSREGL